MNEAGIQKDTALTPRQSRLHRVAQMFVLSALFTPDIATSDTSPQRPWSYVITAHELVMHPTPCASFDVSTFVPPRRIQSSGSIDFLT